MIVCTQCRQAEPIIQIESHLLCVNCYAVLQQAEAHRQQATQQKLEAIRAHQNYLSEMMAFSMGLRATAPQHPTPQPIHAQINNNQMNIKDSNIGMLNAGSISNVKSISVNLVAVANSGAAEVAEELARVATAIVQSKDVDEANRDEMLQQLNTLSEYAAKPAQSRALGIIRPVVASLAKSLTNVANLAQVWSVSGDVIYSYFGIENPFKK